MELDKVFEVDGVLIDFLVISGSVERLINKKYIKI